jgi:acetate---CoA ligase (ADP-forming)
MQQSEPLSGTGDGHVTLRSGSTVHIRPIGSSDEEALAGFFDGLSEEARALRFFSSGSRESIRREAARQTAVEGDGRVGLVATAGGGERIIAHATYSLTRGDRAEVAFAIADDYQGQGLGTILLGELARIATARGVRIFEAVVLPQNHRMLSVFRDSGFAVRTDAIPGEIRVQFPTELSSEALERFEEREQTAAANALAAFLRPRSVAVIGASRRRDTIGGEILHNLLSYGFNGPVLPVNPSAGVVQSVVAYPTVEEVPGPVDLAVVVVPAEGVLDVARACGRKGVRALVVITAGFAETGEEGRERQDALLGICREFGMRLIGPNCMGIVNTHPEVRLNATFAPVPPPAGRIGFMSQSGALGLAIMDYAGHLGLGLSSFISVGNKADISGNDLIRYWDQDPDTDLILLYIESFGNPRKFSRIARKVARRKPVVAVKSGRSVAGARAAGSHTGALIAASDVTVDALFRHTGVIRTDTLAEMFDVATLLANQPPPTGRGVAILTNAGGPGILCADTCEAEGLVIPELTEATQQKLRGLLAAEASVANPVDMIASASADQYRQAIEIVAADPNIHSLIVIFIPPLATRLQATARAIVEGATALDGSKPVLTVFMRSQGVPDELRAAGVRLPSYSFPEDAAIALARVAHYGEWRALPLEEPAQFPDVRRDAATAVLAGVLGRGAEWLEADEVLELLSCYGLPTLEQGIASSAEQAAELAGAIGPTVALKAIAPGLVHRSEAGAVRVGLTPAEVLPAARAMEDRLRAGGTPPSGFLVQRMAEPGVEMIVGVAHDRRFGPVVACGAGGTLVELLKDVTVRLTPLSERDAREMIEELKTYPLLTGYRGGPGYDVAALRDAVLRISAMVEDLHQIAELDLNPIIVHERGATIVDARVRVTPPDRTPSVGAADL